MSFSTFNDFTNRFNQLIADQAFAAALDLLKTDGPSFPDRAHLLRNYQIRVLSQMGDIDGALSSFTQNLADGYWFPIHLLGDMGVSPKLGFTRRKQRRFLYKMSQEVKIEGSIGVEHGTILSWLADV